MSCVTVYASRTLCQSKWYAAKLFVMQDSEPMEKQYPLRYNPEKRALWERAARKSKRTLADWIRITLDQAAETELAANNATEGKRKK